MMMPVLVGVGFVGQAVEDTHCHHQVVVVVVKVVVVEASCLVEMEDLEDGFVAAACIVVVGVVQLFEA